MLTLWVTPIGLRRGTDPDDPQLTDIRMTSKLAELADSVILQTRHAAFIRKDRIDKDFAPRRWDGEEWAINPKDFRVVFNGSAVYSDPDFWSPLDEDLARFRKMQDVINSSP